jgi:hypothetical protein
MKRRQAKKIVKAVWNRLWSGRFGTAQKAMRTLAKHRRVVYLGPTSREKRMWKSLGM